MTLVPGRKARAAASVGFLVLAAQAALAGPFAELREGRDGPRLPSPSASPTRTPERSRGAVRPARIRRYVQAAVRSRLLARVDLGAQFERHHRIPELLKDFNGHPFFASIAMDRSGKIHLAFAPSPSGETLVFPTDGLPERPVSVALAPDARYRVSIALNPIDLLASEVVMSPERGFRGRQHRVAGRELQRRLRSASVPLSLAGGPHLFLWGRDADGPARRLAPTRSFYFVKDKDLDSKAWFLPAERVPPGAWVTVSIGAGEVLLHRVDAGTLEIRAPY